MILLEMKERNCKSLTLFIDSVQSFFTLIHDLLFQTFTAHSFVDFLLHFLLELTFVFLFTLFSVELN